MHRIAASGSANEDKGLDVVPPKDDDPDGMKLLQAADRLERAAKFLNPLTTLAPKNIDVWIAIYDVAIRRSKPSAWSLPIYRSLSDREVPAGRAGT